MSGSSSPTFISSKTGVTAEIWPLPPSSRMRSGAGMNFSSFASRRPRRRRITSAMLEKSSAPSTVRILNRRYSLLAGRPPWNTTIEATELVPMVLEMS